MKVTVKRKNCIYILAALLITVSVESFGQESLDLKKIAKDVVEEGKALYRMEKASWLGTDLFLEKKKDRTSLGGYLPYTEDGNTKCAFLSRADRTRVIGTVTFDESFDLDKAKIDMQERGLSSVEEDIFAFRTKALTELNSDTLFKSYSNSKLNMLPLIYKNQKKVYVLTGPKMDGVVLLGNDYLMTFDKQNNLLSKKSIHQNLIPIFFSEEDQNVSAIHSHQSETGEFITATDICTLMLYSRFANWNKHYVISDNYVSIWNCETHDLEIITRKEFDKASKE